MSDLSRIGVAIEEDLLEDFDRLIAERNYPSRSEAFRDLIRDALSRDSVPAGDAAVVGTVTIVYSHSTRQLADRMTTLQHAHHHEVLSSLHVHLDHDNCLEVIVLRGAYEQVKLVADSLIAMKGVRHGQLVMATV